VRQVGPYLVRALILEEGWSQYERTGLNEPLVYELFCQEQCSVAMFGSDKRWKHISAKQAPRLSIRTQVQWFLADYEVDRAQV